MQIVVLGMHRSGTSAITNLLHEMGAHVGDSAELLSPMGCNPEGFWERQDVEAVNDALLSSFNVSWDMPGNLALADLSPKAESDFLQTAQPIVDALNAHKPWAVKDPRFSLLLPQWLPLLDFPLAVLCWRHPVEVARSLKSRDGFPINYGLALWEWYTIAALRATEGIPRLFVSYNELMEDAPRGAAKLYQGCLDLGVSGLSELSAEQAEAIISPKLHRERATAEISGEFLNAQQSELLSWLDNPRDAFAGTVSEGARETLAGVGSLMREVKAANQRTAAANEGLKRSQARTLTCMHWTDGLSDASDVLLRSWSWKIGQYVGKAAGILSRASGGGPDDFLKKTCGEYRNWKKKRDLNVIALVAAYNEERLIATCLDNLISQGIGVYLIDNESTDRTVEIARQFEGCGLIGHETLHRKGCFSQNSLMHREEDIAQELDADWFIRVDVDEIPRPPSGFASLPSAFAAVEDRGFNAVEFMEYSFVATQEHPEHRPEDFQKTMLWYYPHQPFRPHLIRAWRRSFERVDLATTGGHEARFTGRKIYPELFILKHYAYMSRDWVIDKYIGKDFDPAEADKNTWQRILREEDIILPSERELRRYTSDAELDPSSPRVRRFIAEPGHQRGNLRGFPKTDRQPA